MSEFERMCKIIDFKPFKSSQAEARKGMKDAMTKDFNALYGTDVNDLGAWQSLCRVLQFPTIPDNLVECQEVSLSAFQPPYPDLYPYPLS